MDFKKLLIKYNESNLPENFIAITTLIVNKKAVHAGILIRYKNQDFLHHYPGGVCAPVVEENFNLNNGNWYIYKVAEFVNEDEYEVGAFLQYCRRICNNSKISYGYIIDNSKYDANGKFISNSSLPEIGTCVGFCVNTLAGFMIELKEGLFELDDWDDSNISAFYDMEYQENAKARYPNMDLNLYNLFKKRITPIEYLCSSFLDSFPIRKEEVQDLIPFVQAIIDQKAAS
ncbi:UNVERIFIED_CONTAM: hypothetical protein POZ17_22195 [Ralstonia mannitolilytica]